VGVVALFRPIALRIARRTCATPSQLMMPLSAAAPIRGMMTPVATAPNFVVNSEFVHHGEAGFHFSGLTPLEKD
jgi:di/tricarboxylate transporter